MDNFLVNVDKTVINPKNLADFLNLQIEKINIIFKSHPHPVISYKADNSPVTTLDLELSSFIEELFRSHRPDRTFYSEEKFSEWKFPLLALDPLDGTREYISGNPEWAISVGDFPSEKFDGEGWIYNPASGEVFDHGINKEFFEKIKYRGEVSKTEWNKGFYKSIADKKFDIHPVGSIAYKLGRLSHHKCDFVVSLLPKNIWDIAGGTLLCHQAGMKFYSQGKEVTTVQKIYHPPLIWCHPSLFLQLSKVFA